MRDQNKRVFRAKTAGRELLMPELGQVSIGFDRRFLDTAAIAAISLPSFRFTDHRSLTGHYSLATRHLPPATYRPTKIGFVRLPDSALVRPKLQSARD